MLSPDMLKELRAPFPAEALSKIENKAGGRLTSIKAAYVIERLNAVFGIGAWTVSHKVVEATPEEVIVCGQLSLRDFELELPATYGGMRIEADKDRTDLYKGAVTSLITKSASFLEVGLYVYKGEADVPRTVELPAPVAERKGGRSPEYQQALEAMEAAGGADVDAVVAVWRAYPDFQRYRSFRQAHAVALRVAKGEAVPTLAEALAAVAAAADRSDLSGVWRDHPHLQEEQAFASAVRARKGVLSPNGDGDLRYLATGRR